MNTPESALNAPRGKVILLHGIGHILFFSHRKLQRELVRAGYAVRFLRYPSTRFSIEELADDHLAPVVRDVAAQAPVDAPVHFVTFSMGGLLARCFLARHALPQLGRVVMIAPPNGGSDWVDHLGRLPGFRMVYGPSGVQMSTHPQALPKALPPASYECGVIAGKLPGCSLLRPVFRGDASDGTVSVSSTRLAGMKEHCVVPGLHALLYRSPPVIERTLRFLAEGRFNAPQPSKASLQLQREAI
ncbi:MAG: esterase/lipase family protein [Opitutales bacterium]